MPTEPLLDIPHLRPAAATPSAGSPRPTPSYPPPCSNRAHRAFLLRHRSETAPAPPCACASSRSDHRRGLAETPRRPARRSTLPSHSPPPPSFRPPEKPPPPAPDLTSSPRHARRPGHPSPAAPGQTLRPVSVVLFSSSGKLSEYYSPSTSLPNILEKYQVNCGQKIWDAKHKNFSWWVVVGAMATPAVKVDELQPHLVKDQLPNVYYYITSSPWPEAILLGFQHYLIMLGTTGIILTALVRQMGGGNDEKARVIQTLLFVAVHTHAIHAEIPIFDPFGVIFSGNCVALYAYFLTVGGTYKHAAPKTQAHCRIDKSGLICSAPWIRVPYPFQ